MPHFCTEKQITNALKTLGALEKMAMPVTIDRYSSYEEAMDDINDNGRPAQVVTGEIEQGAEWCWVVYGHGILVVSTLLYRALELLRDTLNNNI